MIKSISILNFQSHAKSKFDFADGVNVIVGSSDSGKTAALRALRWLANNRPTGDAMRSTWGGDTNVIVETEDGYVRRVRGKEDHYELKSHGGKDLVFKAFRTDVPDEIVSFLNLSDINLQAQLDAPFLLSETPGNVAQFFNKIAKLDVIDKATSNVNSVILSLAQEIGKEASKDKPATGLIKEIRDLEERIKGYDYLEQMEKDLVYAEEIQKILQDKEQDGGILKNLKDGIDNTFAAIDYYSEVVALEKTVTEAEEKIEKKKKMVSDKARLEELIDVIKENERSIKQQSLLLKAEPDVEKAISVIEKGKQLRKDRDTLVYLSGTIKGYSNDFKLKMSEIASMEAQFQEEMGDVCPLCNQPIKHNHGKD